MVTVDIWRFFKKRGRITYCDQCNMCTHNCKQSYRIVDLMCKKYNRRVVGFNR